MFRIRVKFRKWKGKPYSIERCSGMQYRCRGNAVFASMKELSRHLQTGCSRSVSRVDGKCPKVGESVDVKALYTWDPYDRMRQEYLRLPKDHEYDPCP